jgi:nucleotide-binding universal stress UspA family protein
MDVLVYVDPSPRGEWALALAAQLAAGPVRRRFRLLATVEDVANAPDLLARAGARLGDVEVTTVTRAGPAERAVIGEARAQAWGLVVVPPAGRGALVRMLRGSRVATVVRSVEAPVLVARRPPARVERVLAALSGGRTTDAVVDAALDWENDGAHVDFIHVAAEVAVPGEDRHDAPKDFDRVRTVLVARGRVDALLRHEGPVVDEVLDAFEAGAYHLLVVGARGEDDTGFGREDVTERLLLRCPASTLVVPRPPTRRETGAGPAPAAPGLTGERESV